MPSLSNIWNFFALGGPIVGLLVLISILSLGLIFHKLRQFHQHNVGKKHQIETIVALWTKEQYEASLEQMSMLKNAAGHALAMAMKMRLETGHSRSDIENAVMMVAKQKLYDYQKGIKTLDAITQIAPLVGLFGTVWGMIDAFQALQAAGNAVDPSQLAGGIWVALLTTAGGLVIAIPVSAFTTWLEARIESEQILIEVHTETIISQK